MANDPTPSKAPKFARFMVACCTDKEWKNDALNAFDERFQAINKEFGTKYAQWWAWQQAIRSLPYRSLWFIGPLSGVLGTIFWRIVS